MKHFCRHSLLLVAVVAFVMAPASDSGAAGQRSHEDLLTEWATNKGWIADPLTFSGIGMGYRSNERGTYCIGIVHDRDNGETWKPYNQSGTGKDSQGNITSYSQKTGERMTVAGGIPAIRTYSSSRYVQTRSQVAYDAAGWTYYCHDYRVLVVSQRDTRSNQTGSDPKGLLEDYIAFAKANLAPATASPGAAANPPPSDITDPSQEIRIIKIEGDDCEVDPGSGEFEIGEEGTKLGKYGKIITGRDTTVTISMARRGVLTIKPLTNFNVERFIIESDAIQATTNMKVGEVNVKVDKRYPEIDFSVSTPTCTISVRGTEFNVTHQDSPIRTTIEVLSGKVQVTPILFSASSVSVSAGEQITVYEDRFGELKAFGADGPDAPSGVDMSRSLPPIADSHVYAYEYSGWNKANWGAYDRLGAGWHPSGGEKRTYLAFDLSGVDPAQLGRATLRLFHYHTGGGNALTLGVVRVTGSWTEGTGTYKPSTPAGPGEISWVNQPSFDPRPVAQFHPGPGVDKWVEVDITPLVRTWLSGTPNHGLMIKAEGALTRGTPHTEYGFYSREADAYKRPALLLMDTAGQPLPGGGTGPADAPASGAAPGKFDQAAARLCAPDEDFIRSLYHCITHREPTEQEIQAQVTRLRDGAPRQHMIAYFFASPGYVNQEHDGVRFMTDACQAIFGRQPTAAELKAWPRTDRKTIIADMFTDPAHLEAIRSCAAMWRKEPAAPPPAAPDAETGWKTQHTGPHGSICPKADQWSTSGGGFMVMNGSHRFDKHWFRFGGSPEGPYYLNGEDTKSPPRHSLAEVTRHAKIKQGTLTVRGPGALAYYFRRKSSSPRILSVRCDHGTTFLPPDRRRPNHVSGSELGFQGWQWDGAWIGDFRGNVNDLYGDRPMGGWVPAGQIKTLDVFIEQGWYFVGGTAGFGAPSEIEYELWFFPREGGGIKTEPAPRGGTQP